MAVRHLKFMLSYLNLDPPPVGQKSITKRSKPHAMETTAAIGPETRTVKKDDFASCGQAQEGLLL